MLCEGIIGIVFCEFIMKDDCFDGILMILEIINFDIWVEEIKFLWILLNK